MENGQAPLAWRFDRFTLDLARDVLLGPDGAPVPLRPKALALLKLMVAQAGRVVPREAIMSAVWADVVVGDESITQCVRDVRKALGDEAQTLMQTVPKRGYLLAAEAVPAEPPPAPPPRTERRLSAILAADIVGYSGLIEQDEAGTLAAIRELRALAIDLLLAEHRGRIVKLMGDGAIVEFGSVVDAVACAVAIQKAVALRQGNTPAERRIVFRMGINLGDVVVEGEDLLGDGVNVAARLEQLCEPGGVLVSGTAFDHLQGRLGLPLEFTGEQQVKNIARPVRAYRVKLDGSAAGPSVAPTTSRPTQQWLLAAAAALFAVVFVGGVWHFWPTDPTPGRPLIAVLPFDNLGGDEATGRLADGITEDIVTDLARLRDLEVIARNSTEAYKGRSVDVRQIRKDLGAGYVLDGAIQRQDDRVRVTAQLIDAKDGGHIWAERWDRPTADLFAVQTDIAATAAAKLGGYAGVLQLTQIETAGRKRPDNLGAYELFLLAVEESHKVTKEGNEAAVRLAQQSLAIDPNFARAWTKLAFAYNNLRQLSQDSPELRAKALDAAKHAVLADPLDADAHAALGMMYAFVDGDLAKSEQELAKALDLSPNGWDILVFWAGWGSSFGKPDKGVQMAERALRLNPNPPLWAIGDLSYAFYMAGDWERSLQMERRLPREAFKRNDYIRLAGSLAGLRRQADAADALREALGRYPDLSIEGDIVLARDYSDAERTFIAANMHLAGFPPCAPAEAWTDAPPGAKRLPEC